MSSRETIRSQELSELWMLGVRTTRWNLLPLYPWGRPATLCSPVQNCLKFSAVLGTVLANKCILMRPSGSPAREISNSITRCGMIDVAETDALGEYGRAYCRGRSKMDVHVGIAPQAHVFHSGLSTKQRSPRKSGVVTSSYFGIPPLVGMPLMTSCRRTSTFLTCSNKGTLEKKGTLTT